MQYLWVVALVAGCGRIGFDDLGDGDGGTTGGGDTPRLITVSGFDFDGVDDVALADNGNVMLLGGFVGTATVGGRSVTSQATMNDLYVAAVRADNTTDWLWSGGCTTICNSQGVDFIGGGVVTGGYFEGTLAGGGGITSNAGQDALMMWFSPGGGVIDAQHFGATRNVQIRALDASPTAVAVAGLYLETVDFGLGALPTNNTNDNHFLAVFDPATRAVRWDNSANGAGDIYGNDIAIAPDGSVCVAGRFMAQTSFGGPVLTPQSADAFIARYDAQGNYLWQRATGGPSSEAGHYVAALDNGDCVVAGAYSAGFTWDGNVLPYTGLEEVYVARLAAADGAVTWVRTITGPALDGTMGLASAGNNRIALAAQFGQTAHVIDRDLTSGGGNDGVLLVLDGGGNVVAAHQLAGTGDVDASGGIAFDPSGRHIAVGFTFNGILTIPSLGLSATAFGDFDGGVLVFAAP